MFFVMVSALPERSTKDDLPGSSYLFGSPKGHAVRDDLLILHPQLGSGSPTSPDQFHSYNAMDAGRARNRGAFIATAIFDQQLIGA